MNLGVMVERAGRQYGDDTAIIWGGRNFSFRQISENANRLANGLMGLGVKRGDRVAILMLAQPEYIEAEQACYKTGMIRAGINHRLKPEEISTLIKSVEANTLIVGHEFAEGINQIQPELSCVKKYLCVEGKAHNIPDMLDYHDFIANQSNIKPDIDIDHEEPAMLAFTGGTTGLPKGAVITHRIMLNACLYQQAEQYYLTRKDRLLNIGSLAHGGAGRTPLCFGLGVCMLFLDRFNPKEVCETIQRDRVTILNFQPTTLNRLVHYPDLKDYDLSSLRLVTYSAAPMPPTLIKEAIKIFGRKFVQFYGQAEVPSTITVFPPDEHIIDGTEEEVRLLSSIGRPFSNTEVKIVDEEDKEVALGEVGEIIARGATAIKEYWNNPEATKEKVRNGWVYTSDLAKMDSKGYIYLVGRSRDMIISGGYNIYPSEIEEVIYTHPAISEAAVIGVPDVEWGESVMAVIVLKQGMTCTEEELIEYCKARLSFKSPKSIDFVGELPKSPIGKILKKELRQKYWSGHEREI